MSNFTPAATGDGVRANIQRFGAKLAGMVMPNIGAFIAWGLITALFIPDGWIPNDDIAQMVGPIITFLLPAPDRIHWRQARARAPRWRGRRSGHDGRHRRHATCRCSSAP